MPTCSWVTPRNKSLITTQDEHPICKAVYNVYRWHCRREEIEDFATCTFVNGFHPSLKLDWSISNEQLPFLDLLLKPTTLDRLLYTSIHYKPTDTHISFMHPRTPLVSKLSSFFSDRDQVMPLTPCRAHFRARRDTCWTTQIPSLWCVDIPPFQSAGEEHHHKKPALGTRWPWNSSNITARTQFMRVSPGQHSTRFPWQEHPR